MEIVKEFINTFIESNAFMILWCKLNLKIENIFFKNISIAFITSLVMAVTYPIHGHYTIMLSYITMVCLISFFHKERILKSLLGFCITLILIMILQLILIYILGFFVLGKYVGSCICNISIQSIIFLISVSIYYFAPNKKICNIVEINFKIVFYIIINFVGYILVCKIIWEYNKNLILNNIIMFTSMLIIIFMLNLILCYNILKINEEKKLIEIHNKYNPIIENIIEETRRKQHDFKNHLNTVYSLVLVSDEKNLKVTMAQYMDSLNTSLESMEKLLQIDNTVVAAIIYNKINEAAKNNIEFKYIIEGDYKLPFKDHELSEILNNLLDNAFDAVLNSKSNLKKVFLNIGYLEEKCIIEIGNTGERIEFNDIGKIFNAGYTTKEENHRGYGLYNVKKIVESYGARIQLSFENNYTIFSIKLS